MSKKERRLWGYINGEPYLINGEEDIPPEGEPLFFGKVFITPGKSRKPQIALENPPVPFSRLQDDTYIQIDDIVRVRKCHRRTVARHIEAGLLKVARRVGNEYFFTVSEVKRWIRAIPDLKRGVRIRPLVQSTSKATLGRSMRKEVISGADQKRTTRRK
jgi:hypothetical protein